MTKSKASPLRRRNAEDHAEEREVRIAEIMERAQHHRDQAEHHQQEPTVCWPKPDD